MFVHDNGCKLHRKNIQSPQGIFLVLGTLPVGYISDAIISFFDYLYMNGNVNLNIWNDKL